MRIKFHTITPSGDSSLVKDMFLSRAENLQIDRDPIFVQDYRDFLVDRRFYDGIADFTNSSVWSSISREKYIFDFGQVGASVIPDGEKWEIALFKDGVCYDDQHFNSVIRGQYSWQICKWLEYIKNNDWPEKCNHCDRKLFTETNNLALWRKGRAYCEDCTEETEYPENNVFIEAGMCAHDLRLVYDWLWEKEQDEDKEPLYFFRHLGFIRKRVPDGVCADTQIEYSMHREYILTACKCDSCERQKDQAPPF